MAFYSPNGEIIDVEEFVKIYSDGYFIPNEKVPGFHYTQTSEYVENEIILPILKGHIEDYKDFARIMAWKIGKINHNKSESKICYAADWCNCETDNPQRYGKEMDIHGLADYIIENRVLLEELAVNNPQECLRLLRNQNTKGIGPVYLITIIYFLSHGVMPIYDRFAQAALIAYKNDLKPNCVNEIKVPDIPGKWDSKFATIIENIYNPYIDDLKMLGVDYKEDRRLDQALWVYGHGFKIN